MRAILTICVRTVLATTLVASVSSNAQAPASASSRARRVVAICPLRVDGDNKAAAELEKHLNQTLVQLRIARADAAVVRDLVADLPNKRCPEEDAALAQFGRDSGATDVLVVRVGLFPVVVGGRLVASDAVGRSAQIAPVRIDTVKGSRTDAAKEALSSDVRQLPLDDPGILEPLVEVPTDTKPPNGTGTPPTDTTPPNPPPTVNPPKVAAQSSPLPLIIGGSAAAAVGVGGIIWGLLGDQQFVALAGRGDLTPADVSQLKAFQLQGAIGRGAGTALLVVGAAVAAVGFLQPAPKPASSSVTLTVTPSGVAVFGAF